MDLGAILIGFVILALAVPYVISPFQTDKRPRAKRVQPVETSIRPEGLNQKREITLKRLRELDFDFQTGKVAEEDYRSLREQLVAEASLLIDAVHQEEDRIEQLIRTRREAKAQGTRCPHCGNASRPQDLFCPTCGQAVSASCPHCGKKVQPRDLYCSACGTPLNKSGEVAPTDQKEGK